MQKILIINLGGMGDFLLSTPALRALKSAFPENRLYLLTFPHVAELADKLPYMDRVFRFYKGVKNIPKNLNTLLKLRMEKFDRAVNMRTLVSEKGAKKIKLLLDFIKPASKAGRDTEGRGYFFDIKSFETDIAEKPELEYDIDTVRALGAEVFDKSVNFTITEESRRKIDSILLGSEIAEEDILIGIHPGGKPAHRWPLDNFSRVIEHVHRTIPAKFVITGERDEINVAKRLARSTAADTLNLAGRLQIQELGALIKRCSLFITNDTGPMHIAAAIKTPLVAIFGPGDITRYDPRNISRNAVVLYKNVPCSPCNMARCGSMKCLKAILPEEVIEKSRLFFKKI